MKSILLSIKPKWVEKILNGEKTIEIRRKFPKDYVGWVYIYCTKENKVHKLYDILVNQCVVGWDMVHKPYFAKPCLNYNETCLNGRVVARFWCDKVEEISWQIGAYELEQQWFSEFLDKCCLGFCELKNYLNKKNGYAIHISKLEVFDRPKELSEFNRPCQHWDNEHQCYSKNLVCCAESCKFYKNTKLTKAPQNFVYIDSYIEGEE